MLFAPTGDSEIAAIERSLSFSLPPTYSAFLKIHNGLRLFSGDLWLGGHRASFSRSGDAVWQPFSIVSANQECNLTTDGNEIVIGGEERTGATIRYSTKDGRILKYKQRGKKPISSWDTFETMLISEVSRLALCFDATGHRLL